MRISDWSSDVCSSDLGTRDLGSGEARAAAEALGVVDEVGIPQVGFAARRSQGVHALAWSDDVGLGHAVRQRRTPRRERCACVVEIGRASCRDRVWTYV